jgi:hypothetical protein
MTTKMRMPIVPMTEPVMADLERRGLIIRLIPSREDHRVPVNEGKGKGIAVYQTPIRFGGHALVRCAIDYPSFHHFGTHPDNEEFLLLGGNHEKDLLLLVSFLSKNAFIEKLDKQELSATDFVCIKCEPNNPNLSFFVMLKDVPHGECVVGQGLPATFYVTEAAYLPLDEIDLCKTYDFLFQE